jgi:hypothetical protein
MKIDFTHEGEMVRGVPRQFEPGAIEMYECQRTSHVHGIERPKRRVGRKGRPSDVRAPEPHLGKQLSQRPPDIVEIAAQ